MCSLFLLTTMDTTESLSLMRLKSNCLKGTEQFVTSRSLAVLIALVNSLEQWAQSSTMTPQHSVALFLKTKSLETYAPYLQTRTQGYKS